MACTVAECDAILAACRENNLRCDITYTQRERVCNVEMKRIIDSGALGRVLRIQNTQVVPDGMKTTPHGSCKRKTGHPPGPWDPQPRPDPVADRARGC